MPECLRALGAALLTALAASVAWAADAKHGEAVFQACRACHNDQREALGPSLKGVVGREAGSLEGFRYSNAMKRAGFTWTEASLKDYLINPQAKVKGNRMAFSGLTTPGDIDDVIAYLESLH